MKIAFLTCDVFTDRPFTGNPLLVVPDARGLTTEQMQNVAREINYSESTFVLPPKDPKNAYLQRTFVPVKEIPYAGHPTVGTAVAMASLGKVATANAAGTAKLTIEVGFGPLDLELERTPGRPHRVRMAQGPPAPGKPVTAADVKGKLAAALGVAFDALHPDLPPQPVSTGNRFLMAPLASLEAVSSALADARMLNVLEKELDVLGVYFFAFTEGRIRARLFAPGAGVPEDPATGSAAGPLAAYLALHGAVPGGVANGRGRFVIDQGVEMGRPSLLEAEVVVDAASRPTAVFVAGRAVLMMEGTLEV
jgi:trans-2,3-dihydro-3-hydroxyanthranilate isomerase